jgi:SNF2 family DNA or RNA helicase
MTPYESVREQFDFPFELRPYQEQEFTYLCEFDRTGNYAEPGTGKTTMATHHALHRRIAQPKIQWLIAMPPILLLQWELWLARVKHKASGKPLSTTVYAGTPAQRKALPLTSEFILVSYGILKNDFDYLHDYFERRELGIIADEATAIKNTESQTHKAINLIAENRPLQLLTGTPVNKPGDSYAYIKLIAPGVYRNRRQFDRLHMPLGDDYGNVAQWHNLELMAQNMRVQTSRILRREVRKELPPVIYTPVHYKLAPAHLKLYRRLVEERLVEFADGTEIDAISAQALRSSLQQIVVNWGEFANDPRCKPAALEIVEETLEEIGDKKLVVVANFRRSNHYLHTTLAEYGAVAIYGDVTPKGKQDALRAFISDPACRVLLVQPESAGYGIDGLQDVASDMLFLEAPTTPTPFQQVVARLDRDGQLDVVHVRVAIAQGTVQVSMFNNLLNNDDLAYRVQGGYENLRRAVYGSE